MDNQQGHTLWRMELYSMLCGSLDGRGIYERMDTCACMAESLCCSPETITTFLINYVCRLSHFSCVWLFVTLRTVTLQAPLLMGFSGQEYWRALPCPPPGNLPDSGIELESLTSLALAGRFFTTSHLGSLLIDYTPIQNKKCIFFKKETCFSSPLLSLQCHHHRVPCVTYFIHRPYWNPHEKDHCSNPLNTWTSWNYFFPRKHGVPGLYWLLPGLCPEHRQERLAGCSIFQWELAVITTPK